MTIPNPPKCNSCGRERASGEDNYSPMQVILGHPLGWYSGDDGEICGDCMTDLMRKQS